MRSVPLPVSCIPRSYVFEFFSEITSGEVLEDQGLTIHSFSMNSIMLGVKAVRETALKVPLRNIIRSVMTLFGK